MVGEVTDKLAMFAAVLSALYCEARLWPMVSKPLLTVVSPL